MKSVSRLWFVSMMTAVVAAGACLGYEDEGVQWWSSAGASTKLGEDWKASFAQEFRLGDDGGNLYYEHSELTFTYSGLADWLDVGAAFRLIYEKDNSGEWKRESRPHLNVTLKWMLFDWRVSSRSRFEYRDRTNREDVWRYRNKFTVKFPFELTRLKLMPYAADEIFITLNDDNVDKNRVYFGFVWPLGKGLDLDIYYMWQASRSGDEWEDVEVLGTGLKFGF